MGRLTFLLLLVAATAVAEPLGAIDGLIRTEQGRPAVDVTVSVLGGDVYTRTGTDGRFVLSGIPVGVQKVRIHADGHADFEFTVPVGEGENTIGTITLQPEMPIIRGDAGQVVAKRVKHDAFFRFAYGADCALSDSLAGVDSTRAWGTCYAHGTAPPVRFGVRPAHRLRRLAILVLAADGSVIRRLRDGAAEIASSRPWDGLDDRGTVAPAGAYAVRFATDRDSVEIPFCRRAVDQDERSHVTHGPDAH